jgi:hypothetical protein
MAAVIITSLLLGVFLGGASASPHRQPPPVSEKPLERLLGLRDLPIGFHLLDFGLTELALPNLGCGAIEPANPQPRLAKFLKRYSPSGCLIAYLRMFRVPGEGPAPFLAGSAAIELPSVEAAEAGLAVSRELLSHLLADKPPREVKPPVTVGDATRLFVAEETPIFEPEEAPSSFLVWRSGKVVSVSFAAGYRSPPSEQTATELAQLQQRHVEAPRPLTRADLDDTEVGLENPNLDVPAYWLGRQFAGHRPLGPLRLADTASTFPAPLGQPRVNLFYRNRLSPQHTELITIDLWSPSQWRRLQAKRRPPGSLRCATAEQLKLRGGHAVIYSGSAPAFRNCRSHARRVYTARVFLAGAVVTVSGGTTCRFCARAEGTYESREGMATIVRGLQARVKPTSLAP